MNTTIGLSLSNIVVPFPDCKWKQDGNNVIIIVPCIDEKSAEDLITSLGSS